MNRSHYCPSGTTQPGASFTMLMLCYPPPTAEQLKLLAEHGYGAPANAIRAASIVRFIKRRAAVALMTDEEKDADAAARYTPPWKRVIEDALG